MARPKVVYWNNQPSPYLVERLNAVMARGSIDLEAWFNVERTSERSWKVDSSQWRFPARYIPQRPLLGQRLHLPFAELKAVRPDVFISLYDRPHFALGSLAARASAQRTAFRVLPNYDTWSERTWWREVGKHVVFRALDAAKVPGPQGRALTVAYGLPAERAHKVQQSIDVPHYASARQMTPEERQRRRAELGLQGCTFIYVGRIWQGKGLDDLVQAYIALCQRHDDVSLLLVGNGVDEARYRAMTEGVPGVVFGGYVQGQDLPQVYALADVLVFPTLGDPHGLVVEEAFAAGLPVICTENAGDIRLRLPDGEAGYVVPIQDAATLAERMGRLAADPALRQRMAERAWQIVQPQAHEAYARDFEAFVEAVLRTPPRRTPVAWFARAVGGLLLASSSDSPAPLVQAVQAQAAPPV